jgi:hypothetical protein
LTTGGEPAEFFSPLLGVRFVKREDGLTLYHPNGEPFRSLADWINLTNPQRRANAATSEYQRLRALCMAHGLDPDQLEAG